MRDEVGGALGAKGTAEEGGIGRFVERSRPLLASL
jgi:hypothetical protein